MDAVATDAGIRVLIERAEQRDLRAERRDRQAEQRQRSADLRTGARKPESKPAQASDQEDRRRGVDD